MTVCYFLPKSAGISPHLAVSHLMMGLRKKWVFNYHSNGLFQLRPRMIKVGFVVVAYPDERDGTLFFVQRVKEGVTVFTVRICW